MALEIFLHGGTDIAPLLRGRNHRILWRGHTKLSGSHNLLISLPDPGQRLRSWRWLLVSVFLVCSLFLVPKSLHKADGYREDEHVTAWLTKEKARKIMRYHGAHGIKVTTDRVYIKRDGRWICVYQDPSFLPEKEELPTTSTASAKVAGDASWWSLRPFFQSPEG